jgi:hypothetical protein
MLGNWCKRFSGGADRLGSLPGGGRTCLVASGDGPVHLHSPPSEAGSRGVNCRAVDCEGLCGLEAFRDEGEWISVAKSFEMLRPYEQEASSMVDTLLDGLVELFDLL